MPPKSKVYALPKAIQAWLDETLANNGGQQFDALAQELERKGFKISDSALQRYHANDLNPRLEKLRMATQMAQTVAAAAGDAGTMLKAVTRLAQERIFSILNEADDKDLDAVVLSKLTRAVSDLVKATINVDGFVTDARKAALDDATAAAKKVATKAGASPEFLQLLEEEFLGIMR